MSGQAKKYGKISYIEPNDILEEEIYGENKPSFNITYPYENYSISVDLIVCRQKRFGSVVDNDNNEYKSTSNKDETISFFNGKNDYLNDRPGTLIYRDIMNSDIDGSRESLGINSINITYNSYFIPEVTINFTDVRGNALMMSQEENYRRDAMGTNGSVESFFSSLFSFPSPEFKLRVKGFYGKEVEYSLLIEEFKSSFNNDTGNFECIVKFIGKMYGMYNDIPMIFLIVSPFNRYGAKTNKTIWEEKDFRFDDGRKVPTFIELIEKIKTSKEHIKKLNLNSNDIEEYKKTESKKNLLLEIKSAYEEYIDILKDFKGDNNDIFISSDSNLVLLTYYTDIMGTCLFEPLYDKFRISLNKLNDLVHEFNKNNKGETINYLLPYDETSKKIDIKKENSYKIDLSNNSCICKDFNGKNKTLKNYYYTEINRFIYKDDNVIKMPSYTIMEELVHKNKRYFIIENDSFINDIENNIKSINSNLERVDKRLDDSLNNSLINLIGFNPSIKNVFTILMAHLECFIDLYHSFLEKVTDLNERKMDKYGLIQKQTGTRNSDVLLPFPSVKNLNTNTYCYPKKPIVTNTLEETNFIESFFNDLEDYIQNDITNIISDKLSMIPTCLTDLCTKVNPYNFNEKNSSEYYNIDWIFTYFGIRFIQKYFFEKSGLDYNVFGKCEAYNFWIRNKNIDRNTKNILEVSSFCNGKQLKNYLLNNNIQHLNERKRPVYLGLTKGGGLVNENNGKIKINDDFNFPAVLGKWDYNIWKTYLEDKENDNVGEYSFTNDKNTSTRPYNYIKFVDESYLMDWQKEMDDFKYGDYCSEVIWKSLISNYIKPDSDIYKETSYNKNYIYYTSGYRYDTFFNRVTNKRHEEYFNLKDIRDYYNENFPDLKISNIKLSNGCDLFFDDDLTPEKFLNINVDWFKLASRISNGKSIITVPYTVQLALGGVMYHLKKDTESDFKKFINTYYYNDYISIGYIISCLTRNDEKEIVWKFGEIESEDHGSADNFDYYMGIFKSLKDNNFLENDFLKLIRNYERWITSDDEMGFKYFKNKYGLKVKVNDEKEKESVSDALFKYCENIGDNPNHDNIKNDLNKHFTSITGDTKTSFTDRYSMIGYCKGGWFKKDAVTAFFNEDFEAYQHLSKFFRMASKLIIPYPMKYEEVNGYTGEVNKYYNNIDINESDLESCFNAFLGQLNKLYSNKTEDTTEKSNINEDNKLSTYKTFKILHDKYFYKFTDNNEFKKYDMIKKGDNGVPEKNNEFERFYFVDTFFNDLSDKLMVNLDVISSIVEMVIDGVSVSEGGIRHNDMSLYSFMSKIYEKSNMLFMNIPSFDSFKKETIGENLSLMFKPLTYQEGCKNRLEGPSYVGFYSHQPSQHLDNPLSEYENDGFDINNMWDSENGPDSIPDLQNNTGECFIPAFGVEYGSQRQSIFKNIKINMDNPQVTEASVALQFALARNNNDDVRNLSFEGQDLYKIYSNYSYTCNVEMMGCSQIMPLMYFQLNNIPLFRGAYQIYRVEHNITPGNMVTNFTGVRINRSKMPLTETCISLSALKSEMVNNNEINLNTSEVFANVFDSINFENKNEFRSMIGDTNWEITSETLKKGIGESIEFAQGKEERFNMLNPVLRQIIYCIAYDVKNINDNSGNYVLYISSATRLPNEFGEGKSDHLINSEGNSVRKRLKGKNNKGEMVSYNEMGCAVDMYIKKNGKKCMGYETQFLFKIIGENYFDYIRQLIWETRSESDIPTGNITNTIHLSSYGRYNELTDKREIFVSSKDTGFSGEKSGSKNLPDIYLTIAKEIVEKNGDNVRFNNFSNDKLPNSMKV